MVDEFEKVSEIRELATGKNGHELLFAHQKAIKAIELCTANSIAVLGAETFKLLDDGKMQVIDYSGYEVELCDWTAFTAENNRFATTFVQQDSAENNYVYILTAISEREFKELKK